MIGAGDTLTVTGHSLGGHLAALAIRLFPDLFDQAVTFNAPGYDANLGLAEGATGALGITLAVPEVPVPTAIFEGTEGDDTIDIDAATPGGPYQQVVANREAT